MANVIRQGSGMFEYLKRVFFKSTPQLKPQTSSEHADPQRKASRVNSNSTAANEFIASIQGIGNPEYPILDKEYSPSSRVPCTDLVPFITAIFKVVVA
jgi:hypothetical protein